MIVKDSDAAARLSSPFNLINRMKNLSSSPIRKSAMSLFIRPAVIEEAVVAFNPFTANTIEAEQTIVPLDSSSAVRLDDISDDHDSKIELALAHDSALKLLNASVSALSAKLDDVKADKLPSVIAAASRTVESIRRERNEASKNTKDREVHYHFYTPQQKKLTDYAVIEVAQ